MVADLHVGEQVFPVIRRTGGSEQIVQPMLLLVVGIRWPGVAVDDGMEARLCVLIK